MLPGKRRMRKGSKSSATASSSWHGKGPPTKWSTMRTGRSWMGEILHTPLPPSRNRKPAPNGKNARAATKNQHQQHPRSCCSPWRQQRTRTKHLKTATVGGWVVVLTATAAPIAQRHPWSPCQGPQNGPKLASPILTASPTCHGVSRSNCISRFRCAPCFKRQAVVLTLAVP